MRDLVDADLRLEHGSPDRGRGRRCHHRRCATCHRVRAGPLAAPPPGASLGGARRGDGAAGIRPTHRFAAYGGVRHPVSIRIAQPPAPASLLTRLFRRHDAPRLQQAIPATDGASIWLPAACGEADPAVAVDRYRAAALQQAMRAQRGSVDLLVAAAEPHLQDLYLLMEAHAADEAIARTLPGMKGPLDRLRRQALVRRPALEQFAPPRRGVELLLRRLLQAECGRPPADLPPCGSPADSRTQPANSGSGWLLRKFGGCRRPPAACCCVTGGRAICAGVNRRRTVLAR